MIQLKLTQIGNSVGVVLPKHCPSCSASPPARSARVIWRHGCADIWRAGVSKIVFCKNGLEPVIFRCCPSRIGSDVSVRCGGCRADGPGEAMSRQSAKIAGFSGRQTASDRYGIGLNRRCMGRQLAANWHPIGIEWAAIGSQQADFGLVFRPVPVS